MEDRIEGRVAELLPRDLRKAAANLGEAEARYLVDTYYQMQDFRKASANQNRALSESEEPHDVLSHTANQFNAIEVSIKHSLDGFSAAQPLGRWARSNVGVGPVIAAGLLAHIDIAKAPTAGHIWRFAGLDPTMVWKKGQKRPFNAKLKLLAWKMGDSFTKQQNRPNCFYGTLYVERKALEVKRDQAVKLKPPGIAVIPDSNDDSCGYFSLDGENHTAFRFSAEDQWFYGGHSKTAYETLKTRNIQDPDTRKTYESGRLPAGRLDLRARRYAVKIFLSHYQHVGYWLLHNEPPPKPYAITHLGHVHNIQPPNFHDLDL